jgi:hypothetical protein
VVGGTAICRTPGFWATHAGTEKNNSENITYAVMTAGGGVLSICGENIVNTDLNSAGSAVEAMCVPVKGDQSLQLARQLTAASLNCIMTDGNANCTGVDSYSEVFSACDAACPSSTTATVGSYDNVDCIAALDCLNNGGQYDYSSGYCTIGTCVSDSDQSPAGSCSLDLSCPTINDVTYTCVPTEGNCHSQPLENSELGLFFEPPGPAGSSGECNMANKTACTVIQPGENACLNDPLP